MSTKIKLMAMALLALLSVTVSAQNQTPKELVEQGGKYSAAGEYEKAVECYRKAAQQGDAEGQDELGGMYLYGAGVEEDYSVALEWFRKSAAQGFAEGQRDVGLMYHLGLGVEQDYAKALEWYNKAAQQGNAHAEKGLGDLYHSGNGVTQSYEQAVAWYRKAADHNDREAQNALGNCYYSGNGVGKSYEEAVKWYRKSAEQGFWWGEYNLANMYYNGKGVTQDYEQALQWYKKSSEKGVGDALNMVGMIYCLGNGVDKDQKEAAKWFEIAANQGYASAQGNLGYCYENGLGVEEDIHKAAYWYDKAFQQGNTKVKESLAKMCYRMGLQYYGGAVVAQNTDSALYYCQKSADLGYEKAQYKLGQWYEDGDKGIKIDLKKSNHYYGLAAEQGNKKARLSYLYGKFMLDGDVTSLETAADEGLDEAQFELGNCYYNGKGVSKDYVSAYEWYKKASDQGLEKAREKLSNKYYSTAMSKMTDQSAIVKMLTRAAEKGHAEAQFELGKCYHYGKGIKQDYKSAIKWYKEAAEQGNEEARKAFANMKSPEDNNFYYYDNVSNFGIIIRFNKDFMFAYLFPKGSSIRKNSDAYDFDKLLVLAFLGAAKGVYDDGVETCSLLSSNSSELVYKGKNTSVKYRISSDHEKLVFEKDGEKITFDRVTLQRFFDAFH